MKEKLKTKKITLKKLCLNKSTIVEFGVLQSRDEKDAVRGGVIVLPNTRNDCTILPVGNCMDLTIVGWC